MVAPTLAYVPMTPSKYTLPPPIFLPSSGGYTSSRFVEDVSGFKSFRDPQSLLSGFLCSLFTSAFFHFVNTVLTRMEDSCVGRGARTVNRAFLFSSVILQSPHLDLSYPKPYDRPQRPSDRAMSATPDPQLATQDLLPTKQIDPSTFARLFQQLMPVAINEPLAFESKAPIICASFDLDSATSADIIDSVKQQFPAIRNRETTYVSKPFLALCR